MDDMGKHDALMNQLAEIADYFAGCAENAAKGSKAEVHFMVLKNAAKIAREKLKAQEPRVMTLEEVDNTVFWLERKNGECVPVRTEPIKKSTISGQIVYIIDGMILKKDGYGITWRYWTARPTDEQRKAVKWDE